MRAEEALAMDEGALASLRRPRSSIAIACHLRTPRRRVGGGVRGLDRRHRGHRQAPAQGPAGVLRPAIAVALPTLPKPTLLLDAGANAEVKPEMLVQFGHLGAAYAELAYEIDEPRVGLLTIGSEAEKGNKVVKRAHELLQGSPGLHFIGNVEGHDLLTGIADVITTDGFTGNVALKTMEGAVRYAFGELRQTIDGSRDGPGGRVPAALTPARAAPPPRRRGPWRRRTARAERDRGDRARLVQSGRASAPPAGSPPTCRRGPSWRASATESASHIARRSR